jgi:hypothetical protein
MAKVAHSGDADMDAIERQGRFLQKQEDRQAAYAAHRKAWRDDNEIHDVKKDAEV